MTEAQAASATTLTASDAGTVAATTGATDQGSTTVAATDPFSGLDTDTRDWVGKAGVKDVASLAAKARNAESLIGRSIQLPGADAKPEDWDKVYDRLGRPKTPDGFEFKLPEGLPENFAYDKDRATAFKSWAHQAGLTPKQAQAIHDAVVKADGETWRAISADAKKVQDEATAKGVAASQALEKAFGGPKGSDAFNFGVNMAVRAIEGLDKLPGVSGILKSFEAAGLVVDDGKGAKAVLDPTIAIALSHVGKMLFKEDSMVTGGGAGGTDTNPFADGPMKNDTLAMHMVKEDKEKARRLILAVNKQPVDWGIT